MSDSDHSGLKRNLDVPVLQSSCTRAVTAFVCDAFVCISRICMILHGFAFAWIGQKVGFLSYRCTPLIGNWCSCRLVLLGSR